MAIELNFAQIAIIFFIVAAFLFSSIVIDVLTLIIVGIRNFIRFLFKIKIKSIEPLEKAGVSIIIPAYNEEENIKEVIESSFNQTLKPKKVIVIDDNSSDKTVQICMKLKEKYKNLQIIQQKENNGKSYNITYVLKKIPLSEITIVQDADTFLTKTYLEEIIKPFSNKRVVITTGLSLPMRMKGFVGGAIFNGIDFLYKVFSFRKEAQSLRNAISVVTGDSAAYRTSFLKSVGGLPQGTQTEDMDIAWLALEKRHRTVYVPIARANSKDASTIKGHWEQITRWFSGGFQCIFKHNKDLFKAKPLLFTTLIPGYLDGIIYSFSFIMAFLLIPFYPAFSIGFYIADFLFTLLMIIFFDKKGIFHLPEIYFIKFMWSLAGIYAFIKTTTEFTLGRRNWSGKWDRSSFHKNKK